MPQAMREVIATFRKEYAKVPRKLKIIDAFLLSSFTSAVVQFLYMMIVGTFPFNSFLAGIFSSAGFFVLTVCLRMQVNPSNPEFKDVSDESAFFDYVLSNVLLNLVVFNFIG